MRSWSGDRVAQAAGARVMAPGRSKTGPESVTIDSRTAGPGSLFVGLRGSNEDGGRFARQAVAAGAWGTLTTPEHAAALTRPEHTDGAHQPEQAVVLAADDPLEALQRLATEWRREIGAHVIGVTGSTGKTSTKDILKALLAPQRRTVASRANFNTEIGLPLEILAAQIETEVLVLEMAMRGAGQIAELAALAEPDVGVIVSIGPVHLELLGTIEAIAAAKAELIAGLKPQATAVIPAHEPLLEPHLRDDVNTVRFGPGGDVFIASEDDERVTIDHHGEQISLAVPFRQRHMRTNLLAAVAAAKAIGVTPGGRVELALSPGRGQAVELAEGVMLLDDCYNANPMSMRAALDELSALAARGSHARRVAVLGDMLELGPEERRYHSEIGRHARDQGVDVLITVGPLAEAMTDEFDGESYPVANATEAASLALELIRPGDAVLVKASRGVGLEVVCQALSTEDDS
jgi:UDP-N-acetylmuramoyl-tripeptide--D-alanyl-D-alanine ligase